MKIEVHLIDNSVLKAEAENIVMDPMAWAPMVHFQNHKRNADNTRDITNLVSVHQNQIKCVVWLP